MIGAASFLLAAGAAAIQFGWTPLPEGGNEYVVQVEPALIRSFEKEGFSSDVPPELRDIRRIKIQVGSGPVPNGGVTVLKPPLEAAANGQSPGVTSVYDRPGFSVAAAPAAKNAADQRPSLKTMFQADDEEANPKKPPTKSRSEINLTSDETRSTRFDSPGKIAAYESDAQQSPSHFPQRSTGNAANSASGEPADGSKPWLPLLVALVALFASIGGNVYLGWLHYGTRRQYQAVVDQLRAADHGEAYPVDLSS